MKKERTLRKFICDNCKKESEERDDHLSFPYEENWKYLYDFSFKVTQHGDFRCRDKHFCSKVCMLAYISETINKKDLEYGK